MERITDDPTAEYHRRVEALAEKRNLPYDEARAIVGPAPDEALPDFPTQRKDEGYNPVRDASGKELPHYYDRHAPLTDDQVATTRAGVAMVTAMLAAKRRVKREQQ